MRSSCADSHPASLWNKAGLERALAPRGCGGLNSFRLVVYLVGSLAADVILQVPFFAA